MAAVQGRQLPFPSEFEFGLLEDFLVTSWEDMVDQPVGDWSLDSPYDTLSSSRSDVARSPGKIDHSPSSGGSAASQSPGGNSHILTPSSASLHDLSDAAPFEDQASDVMSASPSGHVSPTDGFVHVNARHTPNIAHPSIRPPPAGRSGAWSSTQPSHTSRESSVSQPPHGRNAPWSSLIPSTALVMADRSSDRQSSSSSSYHRPAHPDMTVHSHHYPPTELANELLSGVGEFDGSISSFQSADGMPFRTLSDGSVLQSHYDAAHLPARSYVPYSQPSSADGIAQYESFLAQSYAQPVPHQMQLSGYASSYAYPTENPSVLPSSHSAHAQPLVYGNFATNATHPGLLVPSNATGVTQARRSPFPKAPSIETASQSSTEATATASRPRPNASIAAPPRYHPLVKAGPSTGHGAPQRAAPGVSKLARRGGRSKNSHLPEDTRAKSHEMRKRGACWRCVMQRDPCDHKEPCSRCAVRSQKGQQYFFDCDRSKLPDFVYDFLPPSMTVMHQKQSIEDCVNTQVFEWDHSSGIDIYLNSGYGPPLRWKVYEFKPRTDELLWQLQYFQDPATGQSMRHQKYSPPFGLMKIDTSDSEHFENYLTELLGSDHLGELGWSCYQEETQVDEGCFQASMLDLVCKLYQNTTDHELQQILREILRMMIITYIMGHTLTIAQDTLPTVLSSVQHSYRPSGSSPPFTSPRLANRQLKFFFAIQRDAIYRHVLRWQQATLHQAGKKENTWLAAFCVMLGFAMVLEEVQRTLQVQADAKTDKGEMSGDAALREAYHACDRIDQRFKLLVGLFQCKYRDRKWGDSGSFGPGTPELRDPAARDFLAQLRALVVARQDHLRSRESVTFAPENQCLYTTRLTARFLLPFLSLPGA